MPWLTGPAAERRRIVQGFLVLGQWNAPKLFWEKKPGVQGPNTAVCCLLANPVLSPGLHVTMEAASWSLGRLHMNILYAMDIKNQPRSLSDFRLLLTILESPTRGLELEMSCLEDWLIPSPNLPASSIPQDFSPYLPEWLYIWEQRVLQTGKYPSSHSRGQILWHLIKILRCSYLPIMLFIHCLPT